MRKAISWGLATVLAVSVLAGGAVQAFAASANTTDETALAVVSEENCISGSWKRAENPMLTRKAKAVFDKAFAGLEGASYTPEALLAARRTAKGTEYRVLCRSTGCYPDAQEEYVVVTLQRGWLGQAEIVEIGDPLCPTDLEVEPGAVGAWQAADSPVMTKDAKAAFEKATEGFVGVDYVPVALLSEQVVAGTNYRILCEAATVYPEAEMHYAVVTVYRSLEGSANILSATDTYIS